MSLLWWRSCARYIDNISCSPATYRVPGIYPLRTEPTVWLGQTTWNWNGLVLRWSKGNDVRLSLGLAVFLCQVYRGVLKSDGRAVAIKIQRPGLVQAVTKDLYVLKRAVGVYQKLSDRQERGKLRAFGFRLLPCV